jgi:hypothetical protein
VQTPQAQAAVIFKAAISKKKEHWSHIKPLSKSMTKFITKIIIFLSVMTKLW